MKTSLLLIIFTVGLILFACSTSQNSTTMDGIDKSIGIELSRSDFDSLTHRYVSEMLDSSDIFTVRDYVNMTRIWNTLEIHEMRNEKKVYSDFMDNFFPIRYKKATEITHALLSKGMAMYSAEYDLWFGGSPHPNSQFAIQD